MKSFVSTTPVHDKEMARRFLVGLDPAASGFTFQFFKDSGAAKPKIIHGTLDEVWPTVQMLNTPQQGAGVFVTINETDFRGRRNENIICARALFVDADNEEQAKRCVETFEKCGVVLSMAVKSGRGWHFYFCATIPRDQFTALQKSLIAKVGTDPAINDLPRVMRLPGTLHLKDPTKARLVKLFNQPNYPIQRWRLADLVASLGLSPTNTAATQHLPGTAHASRRRTLLAENVDWEANRPQLRADSPKDSLKDGLEVNIDEIRSAVAAISPAAIATEPDWMRLARALAWEARMFPKRKEILWEILDEASRQAPNYDEADNRRRFERYIGEAFDHDDPITTQTVYHMAVDNGWQGWSPPLAPISTQQMSWTAANTTISFTNIPHRHWLYGTYLIRGEITVVAAPGGAGKTALATGIAVELATGVELLGEKIYKASDLKALFINAEDGGAEIARRVQAFCLAHAHKLMGQSLGRLYVAAADDARLRHLTFLKTTERNVSSLDQAGFQVLEAALEQLRPDLVVLDPLVAFCGGGNMNDNAVMSLVIRELKRLATKFDCAILVVHHTRKGGGTSDGDPEAISGAAAIVNLARRAIMPVPMTTDEANQFGVLPSERLGYFKVIDAKSNFAPRSPDSPWYRLHGVTLNNAEPPIYPHGDSVQAVTREYLQVLGSAPPTAENQQIRSALFGLFRRGKLIDGQHYFYSPSPAGANNERAYLDDAMEAVAAATAPKEWRSDDLKAIVAREVKAMKQAGLIIGKPMKDLMPDPGRFRKGRGLTVNQASVSQATVTSGGADAAANATPVGGGQLVN
jgi:AAA domain/Primase C terminal 2 (PriCT-2)